MMSQDRAVAAQRRYERLYGESAIPAPPLRRKGHTIDQHLESTRAFFYDNRREEQHGLQPRQTPSPYHVQERAHRDVGGASSPAPGLQAVPADVGYSYGRTHTPEWSNWALPSAEHPHRTARLPSSTGTSSDLYSDSPIPWSSRGTTPTSMSSYSPGITQAMSFGPAAKLASPFRGKTPVHNISDTESPSRIPKQAAVARRQRGPQPEYATDQPSGQDPSASAERLALRKKERREKLEQNRLSPPPRKSSQKFKSPSKKESVESARSPQPRERKTEQKAVTKDEARKTAAVSGAGPPRRPSRKGTTALDIETSPVIQSELPPSALKSHRNRLSGISDGQRQPSHMAPTVSSANKIQPQAPQRAPTVRSGSTLSVPSSDTERQTRSKSRARPNAPISPKPPTLKVEHAEPAAKPGKFSRLGIFSRRPKTPSDEQSQPRKPRTLRKGPAAGTGHEGYGKYSQRGRRTSIGSHTSSGERSVSSAARSDSSWKSSNQSGSESELDDFVSQRLEPIVIPGGGGLASHPIQGESSVEGDEKYTTIMDSPADIGDLANYAAIKGKGGGKGDTLSDRSAQVPHHYSPERGRTPTLAVRRSLSRLHKHGKSLEDQHLPTPIRTTRYDGSQSMDTLDSAQSPVPRSDSTAPPMSVSSNEGRRKAKGSRWNLFSRNRRERRTPSPSPERPNVARHVPVAIANVPDIRPIPYYALFDSEQEQEVPSTHPEALGEIFDAIEESPPSDTPAPGAAQTGLGLKTPHGESILLPSPPNFMSQFPAEPSVRAFEAGLPAGTTGVLQKRPALGSDVRSKRLAQVGRIPPVTSDRGHGHLPSLQSYSRPFATTNNMSNADISASKTTEPNRPLLGVRTDPLPSRLFGEPDSSHPASAPVPSGYHAYQHRPMTEAEFLAYSSWHDSVQSSSSSSNKVAGPSSTGNVRPLTLGRQLSEDEVWKEYDDLLDDVLSPSDPDTPGAPPADYFQIAPAATKVPLAYEPPQVPLDPTGSTFLTPDLRATVSSESVRLRRSRIISALHSSVSPSSPSSLAELVAEYEERNRNSTIMLNRMSYLFEEIEEDLERPEDPPRDPQAARISAENRQRNTVLLDIAERYREGPIGLSNLRYGALMISRWLSFSRVLFSPVHNKVTTTPHERVLVLDGLGNDDWSYYCAETYPTANIHSLNSMIQPQTVASESSTEAWPAPPNHHAVKLNPATQTFPYPQSFFAAVVFRFPAAMAENSLKRTLGECYRVLQPGGYLELSVIDLDMINMGNRTRRAVRELKVRMNVADPGISLKPASDNIQKILGRRGFQNLNKCIVSIPVAGIVASGSMDSSSSRQSQGSNRQSESASAPRRPSTAGEPLVRTSTAESSSASERNILLSDLISDNTPKSDQRITKMVAKVGRWWYTRCYEWAVLPDGDLERSIWTDKKVLKECESRGSGFKLLVAYAQKPLDARRRTLSEPSPPTAAVAGGLSRTKLHESA